MRNNGFHAQSVNDPVEHIRSLLGDVVLIPIRPLTKKPIGKQWQERSKESMNDPAYLHSLVGRNIGVLLGEPSGGLCTIDLDDDRDVEPFLDGNPRLRATLRTKRVRGCNIWVFIEGEIPRSAKLTVAENGSVRGFGEWRANGNQTVIWGRAIDKRKGETEPTEYRFLHEVSPIRIRFDEILLPEGVKLAGKDTPTTTPIRLHPESTSCVSACLDVCMAASLHNTPDAILANIKAKCAAQTAFATRHPQLAALYLRLIEPRFQAIAGARNAFIVESVPFLYRAVAASLVLELVGHFYDCNRTLFKDTRQQHMKEAKAMLESVAKTYAESLSACEHEIYGALNEQEQDTFRICRDLALLPEPPREPHTFFLSFAHLADRLGIFPMQAQRIMRQMALYGLIRSLKKGTRRGPGVKGEAGVYRWQLPPTEVLNHPAPKPSTL